MALVLFIILGSILLVRIGADKAASAAADRIADGEKKTREAWIERVTNPELEAEINTYVERPENYKAVLDKVKNVYDEIMSGKRLDELYPRGRWCKAKKEWSFSHHEEVQELICRMSSRNAVRILLAMQGCLMRWDALDGSYMHLSSYSELETEVIEWCANRLKKDGIILEPFSISSDVRRGLYGAEGLGWEL